METYEYPEFYEHPALHEAVLGVCLLRAAAERAVSRADCRDIVRGDIRRIDGLTGQECPADEVFSGIDERLDVVFGRLLAAGLLNAAGDGKYRLSVRGRKMLDENPTGIDESILMDFPEYRQSVHQENGHLSGETTRRYDEGYDAFAEGQDYTHNPYRADSADHQAWSDGWSEALDEEQEHGMRPKRPRQTD